MKEARIEDKKMSWLVSFFSNQGYILNNRYHDEKSANINISAANLIQSIWLMNDEEFDAMYKEGL